MGKQTVPDEIGKELGVAADLRRGHSSPREAKSQKGQYKCAPSPEGNKAIKIPLQDKIGGED